MCTRPRVAPPCLLRVPDACPEPSASRCRFCAPVDPRRAEYSTLPSASVRRPLRAMPRPSRRAKAGKRNASADALPLDEEQPGNNTQAAGCTPKKKVRWKNDDFPGCEEEEQSPSPPRLPPNSADARRTATEHHKHVLEIDNRTGLTPPKFHVAFGRGRGMAQANPERFHSTCWACALRPSMSGKIDFDAPCPWGPWDEMDPEKLLPRHWPKRLCVVDGVLYGRFGQSRA